MNDEKSENDVEVTEEGIELIGLRIDPIYQKLHEPIQKKIDEMFWADKKLTFFLIEAGADKDADFPPEYHIYVERIDSTVDDEPLFSMLETKILSRAKRLWLNLQRLKACLERGIEV